MYGNLNFIRIVLIIAIIGLLLFIVSLDDSEANESYIGIGGSYLFENIDNHDLDHKMPEFDNSQDSFDERGPGWNIYGGYFVHPLLAIQGTFAYAPFEMESKPKPEPKLEFNPILPMPDRPHSFGTSQERPAASGTTNLDIWTFIVSLRPTLPITSKMRVFGLAGAGYMVVSADRDIRPNEDHYDGWCHQYGVGLEYFLGQDWTVEMSGKFTQNWDDYEYGEINLGIAYHF
jgi:opacity protein-like surface antigen